MSSSGNASFVHDPSHVSSSSSHTPYSARPIKAVPPTTNRSDALRERRRNIFLKKVKQDRDDARWGSRIEDVRHSFIHFPQAQLLTVKQMALLDYKTEKHRWEAEQARLAPPTFSDPPEEAEDDHQIENPSSSEGPQWSSQMVFSQPTSHYAPYQESQYQHQQALGMGFTPLSEFEADAVLRQENEELEALIDMMESQQLPTYPQQQQGEGFDASRLQEQEHEHEGSSVFGSDDEEYDSIFMDLIDDQGGNGQQIQQEDEEMDMS